MLPVTYLGYSCRTSSVLSVASHMRAGGQQACVTHVAPCNGQALKIVSSVQGQQHPLCGLEHPG